MAHTLDTKAGQYGGYALLITAEAVIFSPLILVAYSIDPSIIDSAAIITLVGCVGLIATAMIKRKDFSFLRGILTWGGMLALGAIIGATLFNFQLGQWFVVGMIGFAGAAVLYDTSNVLHHYPTDKYVGASMELFASIMLMFWVCVAVLPQPRVIRQGMNLSVYERPAVRAVLFSVAAL